MGIRSQSVDYQQLEASGDNFWFTRFSMLSDPDPGNKSEVRICHEQVPWRNECDSVGPDPEVRVRRQQRVPDPELPTSRARKAPDGAVCAVGYIDVAARAECDRIGHNHVSGVWQTLGLATSPDPPNPVRGRIETRQRRIQIALRVNGESEHAGTEIIRDGRIEGRDDGCRAI